MYLQLQYFVFFSIVSKFKRDVVTQMGFVEDLLLFVVKGLFPMRIIESIWF
jgi:hypothetical protein